MIKKPLSELANENDIRIGSIRYAFYLMTAPFIYFIESYPSYDGTPFELDRNYFINRVVEKRLRQESEDKQADLEKRVADNQN